MKLVTLIIVLGISTGLFFWPTYGTRAMMEETRPLQAEKAELSQAIASAKEIQEVRDELNEKYNAINRDDIEKIDKKFLPSHVDSVRVILELDSIAQKFSLSLRNIVVAEQDIEAIAANSADEARFASVRFSFSVKGDYGDFKMFLASLERSLRIMDVEAISFAANDISQEYEFSVTLQTYWLRNAQ